MAHHEAPEVVYRWLHANDGVKPSLRREIGNQLGTEQQLFHLRITGRIVATE